MHAGCYIINDRKGVMLMAVKISRKAVEHFARDKGWKISELGEKSGLGSATVYRALRGEEFNSGTLEKLSAAFECNPIDLLDVDEYRTPLVEAQGGAFLSA